MKKNCAFTICSRSYIGMANVLRNSFCEYNKDFDFFIILADTDILKFDNCLYAENILEEYISNLKFQEMAYKYDVTEFCTSLKPFCLQYFLNKNYDLVVYIDPDICFYSSFNELNDSTKSIYLTPHILTMKCKYDGDEKEENFLKYGIFNCGFIGFRNTEISKEILKWWGCKLFDNSYADAEWGVYTDQKWIDFIPSFVDANDLFIIKNYGCNVAPWNFFEREIITVEDKLVVRERDKKEKQNNLVFIHYSGFNYSKLLNGVIEHNCRNLNEYQDISVMLLNYGEQLKNEKIDNYFRYKYLYNYYEDDTTVLMLHRRLYRRLLENGITYKNLFTVDGEYYNFLKRKHLLVKKSPDIKSKKNVSNFESKKKLVSVFYKICFRVLGVSRFIEFLKALQKYSRFEEQLPNL